MNPRYLKSLEDDQTVVLDTIVAKFRLLQQMQAQVQQQWDALTSGSGNMDSARRTLEEMLLKAEQTMAESSLQVERAVEEMPRQWRRKAEEALEGDPHSAKAFLYRQALAQHQRDIKKNLQESQRDFEAAQDKVRLQMKTLREIFKDSFSDV